MPIIPRVGRKSLRIRMLFAGMYLALSVGAVAMVYPFLIMLATSITSSADTNDFRVLPHFLFSDDALFAKYVDDKYGGDLETANRLYHTHFLGIANVRLAPATDQQSVELKSWTEFLKVTPDRFKSTAFRGYGLHPSKLDSLYRAHIRQLFGGDIHALNHAYTEENETFQTVRPPVERPNKRTLVQDTSRKFQDFLIWKMNLADDLKPITSVHEMWVRFLAEDQKQYAGNPALAANLWGPVTSFNDIPLSPSVPVNRLQHQDWETFVRNKIPFRYLNLGDQGVHYYQQFLWHKYQSITNFNAVYHVDYTDFAQVPLPVSIPDGGPIGTDFATFVRTAMPIRIVHIDSPESRFSEFKKSSGIQLSLPYYQIDSDFVRKNGTSLRREYIGGNYSLIAEYLLLHGRSLVVTAIYCLLAVGSTLIVNPLCAYALSQFSLPYAYRVLMLLLATMAFPAEVAMIPNFLLLKQLGLLNTYWALVLPGVASGYSIFLLKGFFDSLPRDLFESGRIDGASDARMYFKIALPLSRPIFAVIALHAFVGAYSAFMFAMLVCQNSKMWTIMVWLYELQEKNPQYIMMAGAVVAAIPTMIVFAFAQNVIMRGIVLPTDK